MDITLGIIRGNEGNEKGEIPEQSLFQLRGSLGQTHLHSGYLFSTTNIYHSIVDTDKMVKKIKGYDPVSE